MRAGVPLDRPVDGAGGAEDTVGSGREEGGNLVPAVGLDSNAGAVGIIRAITREAIEVSVVVGEVKNGGESVVDIPKSVASLVRYRIRPFWPECANRSSSSADRLGNSSARARG